MESDSREGTKSPRAHTAELPRCGGLGASPISVKFSFTERNALRKRQNRSTASPDAVLPLPMSLISIPTLLPVSVKSQPSGMPRAAPAESLNLLGGLTHQWFFLGASALCHRCSLDPRRALILIRKKLICCRQCLTRFLLDMHLKAPYELHPCRSRRERHALGTEQ